MNLEYVPLLSLHRELYLLPRRSARFQHYLQLLKDPERDDVSNPPLVAINPMAKEHVLALVEQLLAINADAIGADAQSA